MNIIYEGNGYFIGEESGKFFFIDDRDTSALSHEIKHPDYIRYDDNKGWCYKNGKDLPWA